MTFFTHDQAIKAVTFQYPTLKHGIDYLVVMKVQLGRGPVIPFEDAQIAWWDATETQPTIDDLKALYTSNNLDTWTPPKPTNP